VVVQYAYNVDIVNVIKKRKIYFNVEIINKVYKVRLYIPYLYKKQGEILMKVLFCNIAWMEYYRGISANDIPENGGKWIKEKIQLEECENFLVREDENFRGYIYTKPSRGKDGILKLENIEECSNDDMLENVLVIWVAKDPFQNKLNIIGWYKNATVYRNVKLDENENKYNVCAKQADCVLLPINKRHKIVPKASKSTGSYGIGQSNIWYAKDINAQKYVKNMLEYINEYNDENLLFELNY
jgi:hypothetical protein